MFSCLMCGQTYQDTARYADAYDVCNGCTATADPRKWIEVLDHYCKALAEAREALASLVRDIDDETDGEGLPCCQADTWDMCLRVLEEGKK
jgi:hypothetical protein